MQEGPRNTPAYDQTRALSNCECVFLLRRTIEDTNMVEIRADFSPVCKTLTSSHSGDSQCFSTLPTFNKDDKFYTPSFILQEDKARFQDNSSQCLSNHQRKVQEFLEEKDELFVPKPSKANRFCLICKETYEDYLTHISYPSHNRLLKSSSFYNDVLQLCQRINPSYYFKADKKIKKERKKRQTCRGSQKKKESRSQKSNQALSTGLQSSQEGHLCVSVK